MEAYLRLIHLQEIFEELAEADNRLGAARDRLQLAEVLTIHGPEDEVTVLLRVTDVAEGSTEA